MSSQCGKGRSLVAVDNLLDSIGLYRKNVAYDETCLFRAISEQLFGCQIHHERVRKESIEYARDNYNQFNELINNQQQWYEHLHLLEKHMAICGNIEIQIISRKYNRDIMIYDANQQILINVTKRDLDQSLMLCLMNEDHYDVIYKREHIQNAGYCQSIVYGLLYEDVFKIPDVSNIVHGMLYDKGVVSLTTNDINNNNNDEQQQTNIAPFPFKVAKALDPTIYRNIEFDSWAEVRKQMRLGDWYYGDNNLILGTRCLYNANNETFECYIQEMIRDQNRCVIYLTKFGEKRTVDYTDLSPEDDAKPWPLPYRFSKNLVLTTKNQTIEKNPKNSKKRKDKRLNKTTEIKCQSITTTTTTTTTTSTTTVSTTTTTTTTTQTKNNESDINAYIGAPLQIQNNIDTNDYPSSEIQKESDNSLSQHNLLITPDVASPIQKFTFESSTWNTTTESVVWPQVTTTNQNIKPVVTSVPTTPLIFPYYDNSYPFVYNYGVDNYNNSWSGQTDYVQQESIDNDRELSITETITTNYQNYQNDNYEQTQTVNERPTLCTMIPPNDQQQQQQQSVEVYSPVIQIPPGTPVIYAHTPEMNEMFIPTAPHVPIYTPPIQYVQSNAYVYPNTPPTWYSPTTIHPQHGFVFPTPYNQNITQ